MPQPRQALRPVATARLTTSARPKAEMRFPVACLITVALLWLQAGCASVPTPVPTAAAVTPTAPSPTSPPPIPTPTTPSATPTPAPEPPNRKDAFEVDYFPWAATAQLPAYTGEGRARVFNSIFFADPPFFGLDINPPEGWYHVVGIEEYATLNGRLISPTIDPQWQPRDGDRILLHGHVDGQSIVASFVGVSGSAPYYYRSLLSAEELESDRVPRAYDGLFVWVRGELDVSEGAGLFYELPGGASFDAGYIGREAIVAGRLSFEDRIIVHVSSDIFIKEDEAHVSIFDSSSSASTWAASHRGTVLELDPSLTQLLLQNHSGAVIEVSLGEDTRINFADGSPAAAQALTTGQVIELAGQASSESVVSADTVTIIGVAPLGQPQAVYVASDGAALWSIGLEDRTPRLLLTAPEAHPGCNLNNAQLAPDGGAVAIECADGPGSDLLTADLQTGTWREWLIDDGWSESQPAWSPDAQRVALCRHEVRDGQIVDAGLWLLSLLDGDVRQIADAAAEGLQTVAPQWSPDGRHVAYGQISTSGEQPATLYVLTFPRQQQQIVDEARDWRWSPDASQLLVTRRAEEQSRSRLWIVQRDGTSLTWLSIAGVYDQLGRWSPDGRQIAFLSRPWPSSGPDRLCIMLANGMRRLQPRGQPFASTVAWSSDGGGILFIHLNEEGQTGGLWLATPDGSSLTLLAEDAVALIGSYREPGFTSASGSD